MQNSDPGNSPPPTPVAPPVAPPVASDAAARSKRIPVELTGLDMRIARDGTWFYRGSPIARLPLVKLFASVLRREADGGYWLVTPAERGRVVVEDAPFIAVEVDVQGEGHDRKLIFRTNIDEIVAAGSEHPLRIDTAEDGTPSPYLLVRPGLDALLARQVFYELADLGHEEVIDGETQFGLWSNGAFFSLGDPGDDEE